MKVKYQEYELSKGERVIALGLIILAAVVIAWMMYDSILFAPIGIITYKPICKIYKQYQIKKRNKRLALEFNDFLYYISVSFSLGRTMTQAMEEGKDNLGQIYGNDSLLASELDCILTEIRETNVADVPLIMDFAQRTGNEDIMDFAAMYENCKETGGNIMDAITTATNLITEKIQIEDEIVSSASQRMLEGRIIALMPFLIILFLKATGPEYIGVMYTTMAGRIIMSIVLLSVIISWLLVDRITKVKI